MPYNMIEVIESIVDYGEFLEVHRNYAEKHHRWILPHGGTPVGVIANQPSFLAGVLDIEASRKGCPFRSFLRLFQYSDLNAGRRTGILTG